MSSGNSIEIKKVGLEYLDQAADLEKQYMLPPLTFPFSKEELEPIFNDRMMWGLVIDNKLIGKVGYIKDKNGGFELDGMVVAPDYRGRNWGSKLISQSLKEVLMLNPSKIYLYVNPKNSPAVVLYLKQGFAVDDWIPNKFNDGENRLKMSLLKTRI